MSTPEPPNDPKFVSPDGKRRFASEESSKLSGAAGAVRPGQNPYLPAGDSGDAEDPSRVFGQPGPHAAGSGGYPGAAGVGQSTTASGQLPQAGSPASGYSPQGYPGSAYPVQAGSSYPGQAGAYGPPGQYPMYAQGGQPYPVQDQRKGFSITAMVLGILSVLMFFLWGVLAVLAVIFGHIALKKEPAGKGMAITGLVLGYVMIGATILFGIFYAWLVASYVASSP